MSDSEKQDPFKPKRRAREKLMDYLAKRDHSEKELRTKLAKHFETEEIEAALSEARERGWLAPPDELAKKAARTLGRKEKSHRYIGQFLKKHGLPSVARDAGSELEKARTVVERKFRKAQDFDFEEKKKVYRYLLNRGFDQDTIHRVLNSRNLQD